MAFSRAFLHSFILSFMMLHLLAAELENTTDSQLAVAPYLSRMSLLTTTGCNGECSRRCRWSSRHNLCMRACGSCCARCSCVPPGNWGDEELCPCYNGLNIHGGHKKCP
ncbi:hypothetical protein HPP92_023776 [Vanilla planifolia]|uniref:Snakin-2 n=1 Tax=Vanilla planifolia TaxID=51239 RepID=A0A835PMN3_VANPL|nr:hypothetical protein HPP92_023776 [Vanilla planifolia]